MQLHRQDHFVLDIQALLFNKDGFKINQKVIHDSIKDVVVVVVVKTAKMKQKKTAFH